MKVNTQFRNCRLNLSGWSPGIDSIAEDEVRVVVIPLDRGPVNQELLAYLTEDERERAIRYRVEKAHHQFVTTRGILRLLLGKLLQIDPANVPIGYTGAGKPILEIDPPPLHFNVTHTDGLALIALAQRKLGIDVERLRTVANPEGLVTRFFSPAEQSEFLALDESRKMAGFFRGWTSKEALIKAAGFSVAYLDTFDVQLNPDQPARLLASRHPELMSCQWALAGLAPAEGYVAAIAVEGVAEIC